MFKELFVELRPLILIGWFVAAVRFGLEFAFPDNEKIPFMASVYVVMAALIMFCGMKGLLDHLVWKKLLRGCGILGVLCWGVPSLVTYTTAQVAGWDHGRFFYDQAYHDAVETAKKAGAEDPEAAAEKALGHGDRSRSAPRGDSVGEQVLRGAGVAGITTVAGAVWCLFWSSIFVGLLSRGRRTGGG